VRQLNFLALAGSPQYGEADVQVRHPIRRPQSDLEEQKIIMAKITLGMATAHGPQITLPPDAWDLRAEADRENPNHWYRGKKYKFDQLVELRRDEKLVEKSAPRAKQGYFDRCQAALQELSQVFAKTKPDIAVIFGNDQAEIFTETDIPAIAVYWGETIANVAKTPEMIAKMGKGVTPAEASYCPPGGAVYPGQPELGRHLIEHLVEHGFDVSQSQKFPVGPRGNNSVPHAYGFIYRRIMNDHVIPNVPVLINTHNPPNRPLVGRCIDLGRALAKAIADWPTDASVALIASGGMTHYAIDEIFDRMVLAAMAADDDAKLRQIDESMFASGGTAEIKSWMSVFGAMSEIGAPMTLVDYVPCYRSEAGTGNAMGFVYWKP
jgi:Catalytic LigB subunit of aromatic ring-opening dioxygenase